MSSRQQDEEMRREFERLRAAMFGSIQPFPHVPFFGPSFMDPFAPFGPPMPQAPPSTQGADSEEEIMRRVLQESRRAEEERMRKQAKEEEEKIKRLQEEQMNLDYLGEEDDEQLQQALAASIHEKPSTPSPVLQHMVDEEIDAELSEAIAASVELDRTAKEAAAKKQQEEEAERRRQLEMGYSEQMDEETDEEMMHAIAASLEAERNAHKRREEEKKKKDTAMLEEQLRGLLGNNFFSMKESDTPYELDVSEEERRERLRRQAEADERQLLREQQDEEFQASLERDRQIENERREKEAKETREKREQERREAETQRKQEDLKRRKEQRIQEMQKKIETLPAEPAKDSNTTDLVCRLPTGKRVGRRFYKGTPLAIVKDWVDSVLADEIVEMHNEPSHKHEDEAEEEEKLLFSYDLVTDFPRKTFDNLSLTLEEAGLVPRALISVAMHA